MSVTSLNKVVYSGRDFKTVTDDILARMQVQFAADFNDFTVSSMAIVLLDAMAFGLDTLSFYLDRRATEVYLTTARTPNAVSQITQSYGYKMKGAVPSSTSLQVNLKQVYAFAVPILKLTKFLGPNGLIFEAGQDTMIPASTGTATLFQIPVYQGQTLSENFVASADGVLDQIFNLSKVPAGQYLSFGSVQAVVDGLAWSETDFLSYATTNQFVVDYVSSPPTIAFGDGNAGNVPGNSASIVVTYIATSGDQGYASKGTILATKAPLVANFTNINLAVTNISGTIGGYPPESTASAKINAPGALKSRDAAVTVSDYESQAGSFADPRYGRVVSAQAFISRSAGTDLVLQEQSTVILESVQDQVVPANATVAAATLTLKNIEVQVGVIETNNTQVASQASVIGPAALEIYNDALIVSTDLSGISPVLNIVSNNVGSLNGGITGVIPAFLQALPTGTPSQLTSADLTTLLGYLSTAAASSDTISVLLKNYQGKINTISSDAQEITAANNLLTTSSGLIGPAATAITTDVASVLANLATIQTVVVDNSSTVSASLATISAHLSGILADESKTNVVFVPILSVDSNGFYAAPSSGLIQSLQTRLNAIKEVTQVPVVVSGASFLVSAVIVIRLGIVSTPVRMESTIISEVQSAVDNLLKRRNPAAILFISDFEVLTPIQDVSYYNVSIQGYYAQDGSTVLTDKLDQSGNLVPGAGYTVTEGLVTINPEFASP